MNELEQTMRRYLLGELSESEQSALEEKYFTDPQLFSEVLETESELVDGYVRGQLGSDERARFERSYMAHPARSHRVKFAAALAGRLDRIEKPVVQEQITESVSWWKRLLASLHGGRPALRFSVALATLLVVLGGVWLLLESRRRQQSELARTQVAPEAHEQRERAGAAQPAPDVAGRAESSPQQTLQPTPRHTSAPRFVSLALIVGGVRGGDNATTPTLVVPPGTIEARLLLNLKENNYSSYRGSLLTIAGTEIFNQTNVKPLSTKSGIRFIFTVPAQNFATGDYVLALQGISPDGQIDDLSKSLFRVEKK